MNNISEVRPYIYLGTAYHARLETEEFQLAGIEIVINCCKELSYESTLCTQYQYSIDDEATDNSFADSIDDIADLIYKYVQLQKKIYIHCIQGISRSAAVVMYYLMKHEHLSFDRAYATILFIRPCISPHNKFMAELKKRDTYGALNSD